MIRRPPRSTQSRSSAASDVYKRQHQDVPDVAHYGYRDTHVLADLRRVYVDVDYLRAGSELVHLAGHPIVEPHAHRDDQIALVDGVVRVGHAVEPQQPEREGMRLWKAADAQQGGDNRYARCFGELQ